MKAALVNANNVVENVIVWSQGDIAPEGFTVIELEDSHKVGPGWEWISGTDFLDTTPPPPPFIPRVVSARQARLLLLNQGLLADVEAMIAQQDEATRITWEYATEFRRNDPLLVALSQNLGLTEQQVDDFFIQAYQL